MLLAIDVDQRMVSTLKDMVLTSAAQQGHVSKTATMERDLEGAVLFPERDIAVLITEMHVRFADGLGWREHNRLLGHRTC